MEKESIVHKYRLGVALSGGGARGFAHLGALRALEERGLKPDVIAGTSAGSLAGVLYADGYSPAEILALFKDAKFIRFATTTLPRDGFLKTTGLHKFLEKHLRATTFEELKIPLRVVTSDIEKGESVVFDSGDLIPAVTASCTFPIVFTPVKIGGRYLVDGGLFANLPVSVIREDCERVIGVNVSAVVPMPYDRSIKYILERSMHHLMASNALADRETCDYLIESPEISKYPLFELDGMEEIYTKGYNFSVAYLETNKERLKKDFFPSTTPAQSKSLVVALARYLISSLRGKT